VAAPVLRTVRDGRDEDELADAEEDAPDAEGPNNPRRQPTVRSAQHRHCVKPRTDRSSQTAEIPDSHYSHRHGHHEEDHRADQGCLRAVQVIGAAIFAAGNCRGKRLLVAAHPDAARLVGSPSGDVAFPGWWIACVSDASRDCAHAELDPGAPGPTPQPGRSAGRRARRQSRGLRSTEVG
jgi:hypothetical protein